MHGRMWTSVQASIKQREIAIAKISEAQWEILIKLFDLKRQGCRFGPELSKRSIICGYLLDGFSGTVSPSRSFRAARYLNHRPRLNGSATSPFLDYLFAEIGESALTEIFGRLSDVDVESLRDAFDEDWYIIQNQDVERSGVDGFIHYMVDGWREGRDPSLRFSTTGYLRRYADIAASGINPFQHWVLHGREEGRLALDTLDGVESIHDEERAIVGKLFDEDFYRQASNHLNLDAVSLLEDYLQSGWKQGLDPTRSFNGYFYSKLHRLRCNPFVHYLIETCGLSMLQNAFAGISTSDVKIIRDAFDEDWYTYCYPEVRDRGEDPFIHYMTVGWVLRRDPSADFSTNAYLNRYPDIKQCLMNPFQHWVLHGREEGRVGALAVRNIRSRSYSPSVCVVLVNKADAVIDPPMLQSVLNQNYPHVEYVVVGLPLATQAREFLDNESKLRSIILSDLSSSSPSDNIIDLWMVGASASKANLIWFTCSDVIYASNFVEKTISSFADNSVEIAFGGLEMSSGLEVAAEIFESDEFNKLARWNRHLVKPAAAWFANPASFGQEVECHTTFVWRRSLLPAECWRIAATMGSPGILLMFRYMLAGGQVAWVRDATAITRIRGLKTDLRPQSLEAMQTFVAELRRVWGISRSAVESYFKISDTRRDPESSLQTTENVEIRKIDEAMRIDRSEMHVLLLSHGIFAGGGENFPIQLANSLREQGANVSILIFDTSRINEDMRQTIDPLVAIYEAEFVAEYGCEEFVKDAGVSIIHSHGVVGEKHFFDAWDASLQIPYLATLHGSYENSSDEDLPEAFVAKIARCVDHFCYTADKNLTRLAPYAVEQHRLTKVINAMPIDPVEFPLTRAQMGIGEDAVVFTFVARGVREKGWEIAIEAFKATQKARPDCSMHLCLVGEGTETDRLFQKFHSDPAVSFLGYQLRIHGLYRISDVAIVPTRFSGESYPLCIIQAMQASVPIIASDIGEISGMLRLGKLKGGMMIAVTEDDLRFISSLKRAMTKMLDHRTRARYREDASIISRRYDMRHLTSKYIELYKHLLLERKGCHKEEPFEQQRSSLSSHLRRLLSPYIQGLGV